MKVEPAARIDGHIGVPGDKSISHRALLIGALTDGETLVRRWGRSGDTESTLGVVRALGVEVDDRDVDTLVVHGAGLRGLVAPDAPLDCGNAGTLARLITGILAFQDGSFELVGDESLSRRPMERVAVPLREMGALDRRRPTAILPLTGSKALAPRDRVPAAGRERPGEVGDPARRARRERQDDRRRAYAVARPHRADARGNAGRDGHAARPASVTISRPSA